MPVLGRKAMGIIGFMSLTISLIGVLRCGHNTRIFAHVNLSFLDMGSKFSMNSLSKCLQGSQRANGGLVWGFFVQEKNIKLSIT
jgi:hypothetical protein